MCGITVILKASNLTRKFDDKIIFKNISFSLSSGESLAITGRNGSGKSTLIKILSGVLSATEGKVSLIINGSEVKTDSFYRCAGVVSPYLQFYEEFTARENLLNVCRIRSINRHYADEVLEKTGLSGRKDEPVKIYSSGMKQRLRLAFAILTSPKILLLDEPTSNLDSEGIEIVENLMSEMSDAIKIIATNQNREKNYCNYELNLDSETSVRRTDNC